MSAEPSDAPSCQDGDLQFLTDTAYYALLDHESVHKLPSKGKHKQDGLFLERLDSFIEGQLKDIELFANREQRPLDEIRKLTAIPHAKYLFSSDLKFPPFEGVGTSLHHDNLDIPSIRNTLARISTALQHLHSTAELDSLLLVVSPRSAPHPDNNTANSDSSTTSLTPEASWIGGTDLGKEFWMGLKGGGLNGARAFRIKSQMRLEEDSNAKERDSLTNSTNSSPNTVSKITTSPRKKIRSGDIKTELNAAMRQALRLTSGNPAAEMRWTKPASLGESYSVQLVGWPHSVPMRNPSNNSLKDNRLLLELIQSGKLKFIKRVDADFCPMVQDPQLAPRVDELSQPESSDDSADKEPSINKFNQPNLWGYFGKSADISEVVSQVAMVSSGTPPRDRFSAAAGSEPALSSSPRPNMSPHYNEAVWSYVMSASPGSAEKKRKADGHNTQNAQGAKRARPELDEEAG